MRAAAIGLLVAACKPAPAPPISHHTDVEDPKPREQPKLLVQRILSVGANEPTAIRTIWELSIHGSSANLVETEQHASGPFTTERADREAKWTTTSTHVEKGPAHQVGDHLALDLESPGDSLFLRCWHRSLVVATAGARRVPTPGRTGDCTDPGVWIPATPTRVDALICGQGDGLDDGQLSGLDNRNDNIDETLFRFSAAPGIEFVQETNDCFQAAGLRLAK